LTKVTFAGTTNKRFSAISDIESTIAEKRETTIFFIRNKPPYV
jgi:hypothetical protein